MEEILLQAGKTNYHLCLEHERNLNQDNHHSHQNEKSKRKQEFRYHKKPKNFNIEI